MTILDTSVATGDVGARNGLLFDSADPSISHRKFTKRLFWSPAWLVSAANTVLNQRDSGTHNRSNAIAMTRKQRVS